MKLRLKVFRLYDGVHLLCALTRSTLVFKNCGENEDRHALFRRTCKLFRNLTCNIKKTISHLFATKTSDFSAQVYRKSAENVAHHHAHSAVPRTRNYLWSIDVEWERREKASASRNARSVLTLALPIESRVSDLAGFRAGTTLIPARNRRSRFYFSASLWWNMRK